MSGRQAPRDWMLTSLMTLISVYLLVSVADVDAGMCASTSCLNGGQVIMPNSVFGHCRCRCPQQFHGPNCQFVSKRVVDGAPGLAVDARATNIIASHDAERGFSRPSLQDIVSKLRGKERVRGSSRDFHAD